MLKKNFLKLTRKSYRRKLILFGAAIFMSLALTATGFAAWVLSNDAKKEQSGSVEVGAVTETSIELSEITFDKNSAQNDINTFYFEPLANDNSGRVRYDPKTGLSEDLDINIYFSINNYQIVGDFYVEFLIPSTIQDAIDEGYIALKGNTYQNLGEQEIEGVKYNVYKYNIGNAISASGSTSDGVVSYTYDGGDNSGIEKVDIKMTLAFTWGTKFGATDSALGQNPGEYFDKHETGKTVEFAKVKETLNTMKALMHGIEPADYIDLTEEQQEALAAQHPMKNYKVIVYATVG